MAADISDVKPINEDIDCVGPASPFRHVPTDNTSLDEGELPNLPTEDFLASIGLQPRFKKESNKSSDLRNSSLPPGWRRRLIQRKVGKTAGRFDMYIYSPQGLQFRSKVELETYFKKNNLDLNISDFNFTVRDKGLLDITSNITHGGIECNIRKRGSKEIGVVCGVEDQSIHNKSINSEKIMKRRRSKTAGDTPKNVDCKSVPKSNSATAKKLFIRMNFNSPSIKVKNGKTGMANDSQSNSVNHHIASSNAKTGSKKVRNVKKDKQALSENGLTRATKSQHRKVKHDQGGCSAGLVTENHLTNGNKLKTAQRRSKKSFIGVKTDSKLLAYRDFCGLVTPDFKEAANSEQWLPPQSPYNLVEESLYYSSWRLLIASLLLEKGQDENDRLVLWEFFRRWPTVEMAIAVTWQQVHERLQSFGVDEEKARTLVTFSEEYLSKNWRYPCELYGITKYGNDAYRIFCINEWKQVAPENPRLNEYHRWLWVNHRALGIR